MDLIDRGILDDLYRNCRLTYQEMSDKYGISANAIRNRVLGLETSGVIAGYSVTFSPAMIDSTLVFGILATDGSQDEQTFVRRIGQWTGTIAAAAYSDGNYALVVDSTTSSDLLETGSYLRGLPGARGLDMFPVVQLAGKKTSLTPLQLKVLNCLVDDPRMSIVDIAERSRMTSKRVRSILQGLEESEAIRFMARVELGAERSIPFLARIQFDDRKENPNELYPWLREAYPMAFWQMYLSAIQPVAFVLLVADNLTEVYELFRSLRQSPFITSLSVAISIYHEYFPGPRVRRLIQMLVEAGLRKPRQQTVRVSDM